MKILGLDVGFNFPNVFAFFQTEFLNSRIADYILRAIEYVFRNGVCDEMLKQGFYLAFIAFFHDFYVAPLSNAVISGRENSDNFDEIFS